ncbi:hypothetical protein T4A_4484, partial [Trichinella pseudospiralis]
LERNLHAICWSFCYRNVKCPKREFYQIFRKIIDCEISK